MVNHASELDTMVRDINTVHNLFISDQEEKLCMEEGT